MFGHPGQSDSGTDSKWDQGGGEKEIKNVLGGGKEEKRGGFLYCSLNTVPITACYIIVVWNMYSMVHIVDRPLCQIDVQTQSVLKHVTIWYNDNSNFALWAKLRKTISTDETNVTFILYRIVPLVPTLLITLQWEIKFFRWHNFSSSFSERKCYPFLSLSETFRGIN